ncbi:CLIP domain-containing serine protease HP8-like [Drosophila kikkawai]|uniref:CLIP domain-containing serine protease HP8-like n=1 Tax=Drosophila kikkawai TaxID=30033 RepID=A0A6P4IV11_DROKI|nr:spaetzle-processing enzyme-like [Drosophila kikkawai]
MEHISVDPQYKVGEHDYDIALAKMVRDVELSEFVQPLCLPPAREIEGNHISRRLEMAGFVLEHSFNGERTLDVQWRRKVVRHTTSLEFCISLAEALEKLTLSQNHLCGVEIKPNNLMSGSPLMDVEVVDGKPRNFYLVGINTFETESDSASPIYIDGFMRILPFRNWILENIEYAMH